MRFYSVGVKSFGCDVTVVCEKVLVLRKDTLKFLG